MKAKRTGPNSKAHRCEILGCSGVAVSPDDQITGVRMCGTPVL